MARHSNRGRGARPPLPTPPARRRKGLARILWLTQAYVVTHICVAIMWVYLHVFNRTRVYGREHVGNEPNTLVISNHQSMIDSFLVGMEAFFPRSLLKPWLIPWNPAAEENFFRPGILAWFADKWRCIPVKQGRRDLGALRQMIEVLPGGVLTLFPEGGRTRDGSIRPARAGTGLLMLATRPKVVPVAIDGMQDVLPIGAYLPRLGRRVYVAFGPPVDYSAFLDRPRDRDTAQAVVDRVMEHVKRLHDEIRRMRATRG